MKKILFSVLIVFLFTGVQANTPVRFGVTGGLNYTTVSGMEDGGWKVGYKAGVSADLPLGRMLSIQPSLLFSSKGYQSNLFDITDQSGHQYVNAEMTANANYIELPLMLAVKLPLSDKFKITVSAGPYVAYGVAGKTKISGNGSDILNWDTFDGLEVLGKDVYPMEKFDWGFGVGAAVEMNKLKISLNYDQGAQKVYDVSSLLGENKDNYNYGIWLGVGFLF